MLQSAKSYRSGSTYTLRLANLQFGEQRVTAPYLLEQGQPHLFITQDDS